MTTREERLAEVEEVRERVAREDWEWTRERWERWFRETIIRGIMFPTIAEDHGPGWSSREAFERGRAVDFFADAAVARLSDREAVDILAEETRKTIRRLRKFAAAVRVLAWEWERERGKTGDAGGDDAGKGRDLKNTTTKGETA